MCVTGLALMCRLGCPCEAMICVSSGLLVICQSTDQLAEAQAEDVDLAYKISSALTLISPRMTSCSLFQSRLNVGPEVGRGLCKVGVDVHSWVLQPEQVQVQQPLLRRLLVPNLLEDLRQC